MFKSEETRGTLNTSEGHPKITEINPKSSEDFRKLANVAEGRPKILKRFSEELRTFSKNLQNILFSAAFISFIFSVNFFYIINK